MSLRQSNNNNDTPWEILARTPITSSFNDAEKKLLSMFKDKFYWYNLEKDNQQSILKQIRSLPLRDDGSMESNVEAQYNELQKRNSEAIKRVESHRMQLKYLAETKELNRIVVSEQIRYASCQVSCGHSQNITRQNTKAQDTKEHQAKEPRENSPKSNGFKYLKWIVILALILSLAWGIDRFVLSHEVVGLHTVCYVTDTGECYHSSNCSYLHSRNKTTVYRARKRGYRDCSRCTVGKLDVSTKHEPFWSLAISSAVMGVSLFIIKAKRRR